MRRSLFDRNSKRFPDEFQRNLSDLYVANPAVGDE
jgi:hypothetical protein